MKTLLFGCLLLLGISTAAQKRSRFEPPAHRYSISFSPLALADRDKVLLGGFERRLSPHFSVASDAGIIVHSSYLQEDHRVSGFQLRPMVRYYYGYKGRSYIQLHAQYRQARYRLHNWLGKDCVAGVPAYQRLQDFTLQKQTTGIGLVAGLNEPLSQRWLIDLFAGPGALYRHSKILNEPNSCFEPNSNVFTGSREDGWLPNLHLGFRLVYVIK